MNQRRGTQSAFEALPGGAVASVLVWAWSLTPWPPMPPEIASTLVVLATMASSYYLGRRK